MSIPSPHTDPRGFLRALFDAAVAQALPGPEIAAFLPAPPDRASGGRTLVLGAGKASGSMAAAVDALWSKDAPLSGLVVTRYDYVPPAVRPLFSPGLYPLLGRRKGCGPAGEGIGLPDKRGVESYGHRIDPLADHERRLAHHRSAAHQSIAKRLLKNHCEIRQRVRPFEAR